MKSEAGDDATAQEGELQVFLRRLKHIHNTVTSLKTYPGFLIKFIPLQIGRLLTAISPVAIIYIIAQQSDEFDLENITPTQHTWLVILGVLNVFGRLTPFAARYCLDALKEELKTAQCTAVVSKIFELPHSNVIATPTGEMVQLISKVFHNFDTMLPAMYGAIIPIWAEVFVAVILIGIWYGWLGLMQFLLFIIYTVIAFRSAKEKAERNRQSFKIILSEWGKILAVAGSYERAHIFDAVDIEIEGVKKSFVNVSSKVRAVESQEHWEGGMLMFIGLFMTGGFMSMLMFYIGENLSTLELVGLAFYFVIFMGSLEQYAQAISNLRMAVFEYEAFQDFLDKLSEVVDVEDAEELPLIERPSIEFKNVSFSYDGKEILDNVSFKIEGGQTLGLVGPSGCGKSTIMRLLMRFYKASSGTILVDGRDITEVKGASLRSMFSVVTQDAQLFNGNIRDNISYGRPDSSDDEIRKAAELAELKFGDGVECISLDKEIGEKGAKMSGGQQQRVALARAMLKNGMIYLLDEPTTGLDGLVAEQLQQTLDKVSSNATTICITHHLLDLQSADHILYLDGGHIIEEGNFEGLMAQEGKFFEQVEARNTKRESSAEPTDI